jgi:hypothetical protein
MSDFWVAFGSIGSTLGFFAIAWQAYLTREALQHSRTSVELTRESVKVSQLIATDAVRSRLDAQAPAVTVKLSPPPWPPLSWNNTGMPFNPWPYDHQWPFPEQQEGSNRIALQQLLVVQNRSQARVEVRFAGELFVVNENKRPEPAGSMILEPGETGPEVYLMDDFTIKELSENYLAREMGVEVLPHRVRGAVLVNDDRDNGTTDVWELELTGTPVQPHQSRDAVWVVTPYNIVHGGGLRCMEYNLLPPRRRIHWISRVEKRQLPAPEIV